MLEFCCCVFCTFSTIWLFETCYLNIFHVIFFGFCFQQLHFLTISTWYMEPSLNSAPCRDAQIWQAQDWGRLLLNGMHSLKLPRDHINAELAARGRYRLPPQPRYFSVPWSCILVHIILYVQKFSDVLLLCVDVCWCFITYYSYL